MAPKKRWLLWTSPSIEFNQPLATSSCHKPSVCLDFEPAAVIAERVPNDPSTCVDRVVVVLARFYKSTRWNVAQSRSLQHGSRPNRDYRRERRPAGSLLGPMYTHGLRLGSDRVDFERGYPDCGFSMRVPPQRPCISFTCQTTGYSPCTRRSLGTISVPTTMITPNYLSDKSPTKTTKMQERY